MCGSARGRDFPSANKTCLHWFKRAPLIMPEAIQVQERAPAKVKPISADRLDKAAQELSLIKISAARLRSIKAVGTFLDELGLINVNNGRLLGTAQLITEGALHCAELAKKTKEEGMDDQTRQGYLALQLKFLQALDENVAIQLRINREVEVQEKKVGSQAKPFLPGATVSPIQINVVGTVEQPKEKSCNS